MDKLYVLDASGFIYRSYFAIRQMTNSKGESTNALFGFIRSVLKLIKDFDPAYMVAVFDGPNNTSKRTEMYADYKAHRSKMPGDLLHQILWAQDFCRLMGIPELMIPNVEADDTMGSVAKWAEGEGATVYLCTSDKDMCQVVTDKVLILNTFKENLILSPAEVANQYGVTPRQMIDYLAIIGDTSDNIPGVPGLGPKTASELLQTFGTLDNLLDNALEVSGKRKQELLLQYRDQALLSRRLAAIDTSIEIPIRPDFYKLIPCQYFALREFYAGMNFTTLIRELEAQQGPVVKIMSPEEEVSYQLVDEEEALKELIAYLSKHKLVCFDTETTDISPIRAELVGIGFGVQPRKAWYVPVNGKLGLQYVLEALKPFFENPKIAFYGHNLKYDYHVLINYGIYIANIGFDTLLASYILNSHSRQHSLDHLSLEIFDKVKIPISDLIGKGKNQISMKEVSFDKICAYGCEDVDYTARLQQLLSKQLEERNLSHLFYDIELPLMPILAKMERHGIFLDTQYLSDLSKQIAHDIRHLEDSIYALAGETFNLNSPKQLSEILFVKMGIKPPKKTATGHSTNVEVLELLSIEYPIAERLMAYRALEKLRSTYVDALPLEVNPRTNRIHCNFIQSGTATGRLACQDPNLQNIPVRTELGRQIRTAFRPQQEGWSYLAADYSQIELRLLAHLSEDPALIRAFTSNEDIHVYTASLIFDIPIDQVTREQRYQAKTVNFATLYGQQAFSLAQELGIDNKTASTFIQMYFQRYEKVKLFLDRCKESARVSGKAVTIMGRERLIPEINSKNAMIRMGAERLAINTPIQGSQADLIKMAMIKIDQKLTEEKLKGFMILQIHDELIFEVPDEEIPRMQKLVYETMTEIMKLKVPLVVDIHVGKNWKEC